MRASFAIYPRTSARALLLLLAILLNSACQVTSQPRPSPEGKETQARPTARQHTLDRFAAISAATDAGEIDRARMLLAEIDPALLDPALRFEYGSAAAEIALAAGDTAGAIAVHADLVPVGAEQRARHLRFAAVLAAAQSHHAEAARLLMTLAAASSSEAQAIADEIWLHVSATPPLAIAELAATASDDVARGWWTLADRLLRSFDVDAERASLAEWRRAFPLHPAAKHPPTALAGLTDFAPRARRVALLLPLSGALAAAGVAVRDGFVAAYFHAGAQVPIRVYDSAQGPFAGVYEQILADRMDVIVGPLDKPTLSEANQHPGRTIPILALNYLAPDEIATPDLLQLGLAIEDEARDIARRLVEDRLERVAMFSTPDDWSQRAAMEVRTVLAGSPTAIVVDTVIDDPRTTPDTVGAALLVDQSLARKAEIERIVGGRLEFVARRRDDVQAIVALTDSIKARVLAPALAYHFAADIPLYGASTLVQGAPRAALRELDGARVTELPWLVYPDPVRDAVGAAIDGSSSLDSLYALGSDAYRIVDRLGGPGATGIGSVQRLLGATGVLTLGSDGAFHREMVWAVVRDGALAALPTIVQ